MKIEIYDDNKGTYLIHLNDIDMIFLKEIQEEWDNLKK